MARTSSNPPASATGVPKAKELLELSEELGVHYTPNSTERRLKAEFWSKMRESMALNPTAITLADAAKTVSNQKALIASWKEPGFREWFANGDEQRQKMEHLFDVGLDSLEAIFRDTDPKSAGNKIAALKLIAELSGKNRKEDKKQDFNGKSLSELEGLLAGSGLKITATSTTTIEGPEPLDVTPNTN